MDDSILEMMLRSRKPAKEPEVPAADAPEVGSFGWLPEGTGRAEMLELRLKSGNLGALAYGWIEFAEFNLSSVITLHARGTCIRIAGRNLNADVRKGVRLFEGIIHRRVRWIQEADRTSRMASSEQETVVESIQW